VPMPCQGGRAEGGCCACAATVPAMQAAASNARRSGNAETKGK